MYIHIHLSVNEPLNLAMEIQGDINITTSASASLDSVPLDLRGTTLLQGTYVYAYIYVYIYVYICMYIYMYIDV
jgi:hypothetical protein